MLLWDQICLEMFEYWRWGGWCNCIDGGDGGDDFIKFEFVKNGGFVGGIEIDYENFYFFFVEDEQLFEYVLKFGGCEIYFGGVGL